MAAYKNQCEVAEVLISSGADLNAKDKVTVPLAAAESVLTDGQDPNNTWQDGQTPLDLAKTWKSQEMIKLLEAAAAR